MAGPSRIAAALDYLERLKAQADQAGTQTQLQAAKVARDFAGGVGQSLANRARDLGQMGYEAFTSAPSTPQTTAEFAELASQRQPTPMLDATAQGLGQFGKALVTDPVGTGRAMVSGELERARTASTSPAAAGEYAGSFIDPMRIAKALRAAPSVRELIVHHGTPHTFKPTEANPLGEFDASKIGTGEGAQAYGHGIYFAENPKVAGEYQKMEANVLQSPVRTFKGQQLQAGSPQYHAATLVDSMGLNKARKEVANWIATADPRMTREVEGWKQTLDTLNAASAKTDFKTTVSKGSLYKADLPDEMIDKMLDWDKPLSEQSEAVREALLPIVKEAMKKRGTPDRALDYSANRAIGGDIVKSLLVGNGVTRADVSKIMQKAGIPGIKYLDAGSRGAEGTGTRNFVVFPGEEKKVKILERK